MAAAVVSTTLRSRLLTGIGLAFLLFSLWQLGSAMHEHWGQDVSAHPDEAAHFVTGVMVLDYLRDGSGQNPIRFATNYYAHYPKVAIGHWPPMFYAVEATWMLMAGVDIGSARILVILISLLTFAAFYGYSSDGQRPGLTLLAVAVLAHLSVVKITTLLVMSDGLVALLTLLAAWIWLRWADSGKAVYAVAFGLVAGAAILTKGNAWIIGIAIGTAPALAGQWRIYRQLWFWLGGITAFVIGAPFYVLAQSMNTGYPLGNLKGATRGEVIVARVQELLHLDSVLPLLLWILVFLGIARGRRTRPLQWALSVSMVVAMSLFLVIGGLSFEDRVLLPVLPFVVYLGLEGARFIADLSESWGTVFATAALGLIWWTTPLYMSPFRDGYHLLTSLIPVGANVILVASDAVGEGAVTVNRVIQDRSRQGVVLRASKVFSQQNWDGHGYRELMTDAGEVNEFLDKVPVRYVVVDSWGRQEHTQRIKNIVQARMRLLRSASVNGQIVSLYENIGAAGKPIQGLSFSLGPWHGNRVVEVQGRD